MHKGLNVIGAKFCYYTISGLDFIGGGPTKTPQATDVQKSPGPVGLKTVPGRYSKDNCILF